MFPPHQDLMGGGNLEDRLRGLILNNANAQPPSDPANGPITSHQLPHPSIPVQTHGLVGGTNMVPGASEHSQPQVSQSEGSLGSPSQAKKRPNQAQRRQMNSQLSIPINSGPPQNIQAGRGSAGFVPSPHSPWPNQNLGNRPPMYQNQHQHQNQNQSQNQRYPQYSPRFQNQGPGSPYSPRSQFSQSSPQSPMYPYQPGPSPQFSTRQGHQFPQQNQPNSFARPPTQNRQLYQSGPYSGGGRGRPLNGSGEEFSAQTSHLDLLVEGCVPNVGITLEEETEKEAFRSVVEKLCQEAISEYEQQELKNANFDPTSVELHCFGSMKSGFATKASDMDLALLTPKVYPAADSPESPIPRLLEKKLLEHGFGARLLTRTRVPIIKLCQRPTEKLRADLLAERLKWENGFIAEDEDEPLHPEDVAVDHEATTPIDEGVQDSPQGAEIPKDNPLESQEIHETSKENLVENQEVSESSAQLPESTSKNQHEHTLKTLKQKENWPLGDYYNLAKRVLRKLGGRDMTLTSPDLNEEEGKILNDVCKAFISGLNSEQLSSRLRSYQSIRPLFDSSLPYVQRTLQGVWHQIDGERMAMVWEDRPLIECHDKREYECRSHVDAWRILQDKTGPLIESSIYNRQLYQASEKLKSCSSLQLMFLEQIPHEEPVFYHNRACRILNDLSGRDGVYEHVVTPIVIAHYISGIGNIQIREIMQKSSYDGAKFGDVSLCHRALQLAVDYEHGLKVDMFKDEDKDDVRKYISRLQSMTVGDLKSKAALEDELVAKMRILPDPMQISPNKPKDKYKDHLEFPKSNIGIQCDINFSAHLAIHNTLLLRCYSQSDPRVKTMILFIKHWAKVRGINTPYRGTLSSYGYVLMVLHYLVNVAQPFVCPNMQLFNKDPPPYLPPAELEARTICKGRDVRFWRNETEIKSLADRKLLNHNHESVGALLRGFFEYFAQSGQMSTVNSRGFDWGREVLSLRTKSGILTKQEKGWVGAKTVVETTTIAAPPTPSSAKAPESSEVPEPSPVEESKEVQTPKTPKTHMRTVEETKEIRHRYLFAIEDPFELDHNVARTVTHNGIVNIRDEFRRALRIIRSLGKAGEGSDGGLLTPVTDSKKDNSGLQDLLNLLHGRPAISLVKEEQKA